MQYFNIVFSFFALMMAIEMEHCGKSSCLIIGLHLVYDIYYRGIGISFIDS